jgi:hypothetical protein
MPNPNTAAAAGFQMYMPAKPAPTITASNTPTCSDLDR